jgi:penicillin amidase
VSANQQPKPSSGLPVPGYYNLPDRAERAGRPAGQRPEQMERLNTQSLQLEHPTGYFWRVLSPVADSQRLVRDRSLERSVFDSLTQWDGQYTRDNVPPRLFTQLVYEMAHAKPWPMSWVKSSSITCWQRGP